MAKRQKVQKQQKAKRLLSLVIYRKLLPKKKNILIMQKKTHLSQQYDFNIELILHGMYIHIHLEKK